MQTIEDIIAARKPRSGRGKPRTLVHGIGINDADFRTRHEEGGKMILDPAYQAWKEMLRRCYSQKYQAKQPTYIGCSVSNDWETFSKFDQWFLKNYKPGWEIDKDLLLPGNKVYSPDHCIFVPSWLNLFTIANDQSRGEWPIGVHFQKRGKKFVAHCSDPFSGKNEHLGLFSDPESAHQAWLIRKLEHVEAMRPKLDEIDPRLYEAVKVKVLSLR